MLTCKLESCDNPLTKHRKKFCSDQHSLDWYAIQTKKARDLEREASSEVRHCAYVHCGKELDITLHHQRKYCNGTKCYSNQNKLDAKMRLSERKLGKKIKMMPCSNVDCKETYVYHPKRRYCSTECKTIYTERLKKERKKLPVIKQSKGSVPKRFTERGKIHYEGYGETL